MRVRSGSDLVGWAKSDVMVTVYLFSFEAIYIKDL